ncbi:MAG TPA: histidine kinase dimerization/phospho-acceptor domain-containing protein, partial [Ignavibacteriaceae bacterium]
MFKSVIIFLVLLSSLSVNTETYSQKSNTGKTILILFALSPTQPAYHPILNGIRQKLANEFGDRYDIHSEYFDRENYPDEERIEEKFLRYNEKYKDIKLDLLICVGRNGVEVIKKYGDQHITSLPTLSIDFDFSNFGIASDLNLNAQTAVVGLKINIDKMISTALSVFPESTSIYFIAGTSRFDKFLLSIAEQSAKKIDSTKKTVFITDLSMDNILHIVKQQPGKSIIFVPSFNTDSKLVTYYNPEAVRLISTSSVSPVFAYSDMGFGDGSIGGYILSFRKVGLLSGDFAVKLLKGANPNSLRLTEDDYYEYVFDWRELKRWNIHNTATLPGGSSVLFKEINPFEEYKWIIGAGLLFIVIQSILIGNLIRLNRNQKLMTNKIIESENKYREFLHQDRILRLGQLTASLSHELNQPLTAIMSTAQAGIRFIDSNDYTPELLKQILQKIVENDKRTASILSSIRGMLKFEHREKENVNLN